MKKNKKNSNKYFSIFAILVILAFAASVTSAAVSDNITGWAWGGSQDGAGNFSGLGWISANNTNTAGSTVSYGMNIPQFSDGDLSGYAWSENLGYISFNASDLGSCPDGNCVAKRVGDSIEGWARFVGISSNLGNAGGYQGWIKLKGTALDGSSYGVKIAGDKKLNGFAWSDEMGAISFAGSTYYVTLPPPPDVTFGISKIVDLDAVSLPQTVNLTWSATNSPTSCTLNSTNNALWASGSIAIPNGSKDLTITAGSNTGTFTLFCTNVNGDSYPLKEVTVTTGCHVKKCSATQKCEKTSSFDLTGISSAIECANSTLAECSSDADCKPRSVLKWIESSL